MVAIPIALVLILGISYAMRRPLRRIGRVSEGLTKPNGKKGLILLVSNPNSAMYAIEYHYITKGTLEKVWLIPSRDIEDKRFGKDTSDTTKEIIRRIAELKIIEQQGKDLNNDPLIELLRWLAASPTIKQQRNASNNDPQVQQKNLQLLDVKILNGVSPADAQETFDTVNRVFRTSGYQPSEIIADFTGGTKPMSVGMIMACMPVERELEYVPSYVYFDSDNKRHYESFGPFIIDYQHSAFDLVG